MATSMNAYEKLYINMKTRFTVVSDDRECSLGEYMLTRANREKEEDIQDLTVATITPKEPSAVVSFANYISERLMVNEAPQEDKVIRRFPIRTAAAALLSAMLICTFVMTYGATNLNAKSSDDNATYMSISEDIESCKNISEFRIN